MFKIFGGIACFGVDIEPLIGCTIDVFFFPCKQMPMRRMYTFLLGIGLLYFRGISFRVYGERSNTDGVVRESVLYGYHVRGHDGTNGGAGGKEEVRYPYFPLKISIAERLIMLVSEAERRRFSHNKQPMSLSLSQSVDSPCTTC